MLLFAESCTHQSHLQPPLQTVTLIQAPLHAHELALKRRGTQ